MDPCKNVKFARAHGGLEQAIPESLKEAAISAGVKSVYRKLIFFSDESMVPVEAVHEANTTALFDPDKEAAFQAVLRRARE